MIVPTIHFPGNCTEAIEFYKAVFGAQVLGINYRSDAPGDSEYYDSGEKRDLVMHAELEICGLRINAADVEGTKPGSMFLFNAFLPVDDVRNAFGKLRDGGHVTIELKPEFWTALYGEVTDRFGIKWQLMATA